MYMDLGSITKPQLQFHIQLHSFCKSIAQLQLQLYHDREISITIMILIKMYFLTRTKQIR